MQAILARAERTREAGQWEQTIAALEEYLTLEPADEKVQQDLEKARQQLTETQVEGLKTRAHSLARQEHFDEALAAWQGLLKLAPQLEQTIQPEIEKLQQVRSLAGTYAEAQTAFADKNYDQAVSLLKRIIIQDENYKDASRLLAQAIELRRTRPRWWQIKWLWGVEIALVVAGLAWIAFTINPSWIRSLFTPKTVPTITELAANGSSTPAGTGIPANPTAAAPGTIVGPDNAVQAFARPILAAIANLPADYTEDFNDPNSGWPSGKTDRPSGLGIDARGYIDGEYFIRAPALPPDQCCIDSLGDKRTPAFTEVVVTVDFRFITDSSGTACVDAVRLNEDPNKPWYNFCISNNGDYNIAKNTPSSGGVSMASGHIASFKGGPAPNHLMIVAKSNQMAFFLDEQPVQLIQAETVPPGGVVFSISSDTASPLEVRFDNLKVWNIASMPLSQATPTATKPIATRVSETDGMLQVFVPPGGFLMGSADSDPLAGGDEKPQTTVYLQAFWVDQTEVTNAMYAKCVQAGACQTPAAGKSTTQNSRYGNSQFDNYPVTNVSWDSASNYCNWAVRRLPTEAEWEKAARGTDGRIYPWGDQAPDASLLNYDIGNTTEVGHYPIGASPYGALDMAGNVWEWTSSLYRPYPYLANDGREDMRSRGRRVLRSGSFGSKLDSPGDVRSAYRNGGGDDSLPDSQSPSLGFRCVSALAEIYTDLPQRWHGPGFGAKRRILDGLKGYRSGCQ